MKRSARWQGMALAVCLVLGVATLVGCGEASKAPVANAGIDRKVDGLAAVPLDGSASKAGAGGLAYSWKVAKKPVGSKVAPAVGGAANAQLVPDVPGLYVLELTVNDKSGGSASDTVALDVIGVLADAGANALVPVGKAVVLDGSGSKALTGAALKYTWTLTSRPPNSLATLIDPAAVKASFVADAVGEYAVNLVVGDGARKSVPAAVVVRASDVLANSGGNVLSKVGSGAQLDASATTNTSGSPLSYAWSVVKQPAGSNAVLQNATSAAPVLISNVSGDIKVQLTARSRSGATSVKNVTVAAVPTLPPPAHQGIHFDSNHCAFCHNGVTATGKNPTHILTSDECAACHAATNWTPVVTVDHAQVVGVCETCHNGVVAAGKSPSHPLTSDRCDACHATAVWMPAIYFDHSQSLGLCADCHNGVVAKGKGPKHPLTSDKCETCHTVKSWVSGTAVFDHTNVVAPCVNCHQKPVTHYPTTDQCQACHSTNSFAPAIRVDHNEVNGACETCHNGTVARGKPVTHILSTNACSACHSTVLFAPALSVDHTQVVGPCADCHLAGPASGKPLAHIPSSNNCGTCHSTMAWRPAVKVDHTQLNGACVSCHNGVTALGKPVSHLKTKDACQACHSTVAWKPVVAVDHKQVVGSCQSCHNGKLATGKPTGHVRTTAACSACHTTKAWIPARTTPSPTPLP